MKKSLLFILVIWHSFTISAQDNNSKKEKAATNALDHLASGISLYNSKDYTDAIDEFVKCIKLDPHKTEAYHFMGKSFEAKGEYNKAIHTYNTALKFEPKTETDYLTMGVILLEDLRLYKEAIDDFSRALEYNPNNIKALNYRGAAKILTSDEKGAVLDFNKAISLDSNQADAYSNRAIAYYDLNEYELALKDFQKAIKNHPDSFNEYHYYGLTKYKLNDLEGAVEEFKTAIALNPVEPSNYYFRGDAYMALNKKKEACQDFRAALRHGSLEAKERVPEVCK